MDKFKLVSPYEPTGDQPEAIKSLVDGVNKGYDEQTLLGVTGSGKTFTMANVIAELNRPTLVLAHNKPLPHNFAVSLRSFFLKMRLSISYPITTIISRKRIFPQPTLILKKTAQLMMK